GRDGPRRGARRAGRRPPLRRAVRRPRMTVLVTGGSGLIGSHVIEALRSRGETVRALVRPASRAAVEQLGAEAVPGDVTDLAAWRAATQDGKAGRTGGTGGTVRASVHAAALVQRRGGWEDYVALNGEPTRV